MPPIFSENYNFCIQDVHHTLAWPPTFEVNARPLSLSIATCCGDFLNVVGSAITLQYSMKTVQLRQGFRKSVRRVRQR